MLKYQFKNKDIESICKEYNISKKEFEGTQDEIGIFYRDVRTQHLSSIMRSLEIKGRHITKNNSFRIDWGEMENDSKDAHSMWKEGRFIILLPKNIEEDKARYVVAHELGELFYLLEMIEKKLSTQEKDEKQIKDKDTKNLIKYEAIEQIIREECNKNGIKSENHRKANVFGIVIIQERSHFYKHKVPSMGSIVNRSIEDIMKYFK